MFRCLGGHKVLYYRTLILRPPPRITPRDFRVERKGKNAIFLMNNIWNGIGKGKYKLSLNVSISCIDISGLLGDIFKILHMNTLAYCIMSRYCSIVSIFAKTSLKS